MNWKLIGTAFALACAFVGGAGCAADSGETDEGAAEEAAATADELSANAARIVGAYRGEGSLRPPTFQGLVFKQDGTYFADVDTGIRCVRAPCPSHVRLEGRFSATAKYLRLNPVAGSAAESFHGRYRYTLSKSGKLELSRTGAEWADWSNDLDKEVSYCAEANDCPGQNLIAPRCLGQWTCSETRACAYKCGMPPVTNTIWPADADKLVAHTAGGGFTPPPPAGSTCAVGAANYELDVTTGQLSYEVCKLVDWNTPLTTVTGQKTLTKTQLKKVHAAMNDVTLAQSEICGADKPLLTITVTSASQGTKTFKDSFYSCQGKGPFVDNIDGVFGAFHDIVGQ
jgi:hypothetical protein